MAQCEGIGPQIDPPPYERPTPVFLDDLEVTENGEYTPEDGHAFGSVNVSVSGGGGGGNVVTGTFKGTGDGPLSIDVPYTGTGYPVALLIRVKDGTDGTYGATVHRYSMAFWACAKQHPLIAPTFPSSSPSTTDEIDANNGMGGYVWKTSSSNATSYGGAGNQALWLFKNVDAIGSTNSYCVAFKSAKVLSVYIVSSPNLGQYGFMGGIEYEYTIVYSS